MSGFRTPILALQTVCALLLLLVSPTWSAVVDLTGSPVAAIIDKDCVGTHAGTTLNCTAKEFTVSTTFSAAPGTPPFCVAGNSFDFLVDMQLSGSNANRYDITYYTGQVGNSPQINDATKLCSVTAFPMTLPSPWRNLDGNLNACADYIAAGDSIVRINKIKVKCGGDISGYLSIPYTLAYEQNTGNPTCVVTDPTTFPVPTKSKCQTGASTVSGTVKVFSGAYVDVTKQTLPNGDSQAFTFSAAGPAVSTVIALTGSTTLGLPTPTDGTYTPATVATATNSVNNITLTDGQTARFYINALTTAQTLTITEAATTNWETTAAISCSNVTGTPNPTVNNTNRTITTNLTTTNSAAACTITNTKRSRITLAKSINGRVDSADNFTVSATGGGTLTGTTSATTSSPGTTASTTFYSSPGSALTLTDAKAAVSGGPTPLSGYFSNLTCTNAFTGSGATPNSSLPSGLLTTSTSITPAPGDDITCTYTNTKKVNLSLQKTWVNAIVNNAVNITATGLTTLASVANTASETDAAAVQYVRSGDVITLAETFTTGSAANYTAGLACTGTAGLTGNVLTVGAADNAITCTYTNNYTAQPLLSILKFANVGNANPGDTITYTVRITNTGAGAGWNVLLNDEMSPYSYFCVNCGTSGPFSANDSTPPSGLTIPIPAGKPEYYDSSTSTWSNVTPSGGVGAPAGYNANITKWRIPMTGTIRAGGSFSLNYKVMVK